MNILLITQYFWPESFRINDLATGLSQQGHRVTILTGLPNYPEGRLFEGYGFFGRYSEEYEGMKVVRSPLVPRGKGGAVRLALNYLSFAFTTSLMALRTRKDIDLIFVFEPSPITVGIPALVAKKITGAPIIFWVQDLWPESLSATGMVRSSTILLLVDRLVGFIYSGCDLILVQSRAFISSIQEAGVPEKRIRYFPNSAEDYYQPFDLPEDAPEFRELPTGFIIMFAGNVGAAQDFDTILATAMILRDRPDIKWVIVGAGRMFQWLENRIEELGLADTVHLLGRKPAESMPRYFAFADVMLLTLRRDPIFSLTIPSKLQSYLACAKPVIAGIDGEGARIVEESGAGFTCPAESPEELALAALKMYRLSQSDRAAMGQKARSYFEDNFSRSSLLDRLGAWMSEISSYKATKGG